MQNPQLSSRRKRAHLTQFGMTLLHLRNPWIVAFWSFAFPGCGNLTQNRTIKGLVLIIWEFFINNNAHINISIMYSLLGQFSQAKHVVDVRWLLLYIPVYVYAMWDSYRGTVDLNKQFILADHEKHPMAPMALGSLDINFLDVRSPWLAGVLSALTPGLGHLYVHKVITGIFFIVCSIVVIYMSSLLPAVHATLTGHLAAAKAMVNMQWFMYLPSVYCFASYDAYINAIEGNRLFAKVQAGFLRTAYQVKAFKMPI